MRYLFTIVIFLFTISFFSQVKSASDVYVKGYVKKNGTVVPGYYRSAPNYTNRDNFSTRGNTNPYTNKKGWVNPDNKSKKNYTNNYYYSSSQKNNNSSQNISSNNDKNIYSAKNNFMSKDSLDKNYFYALEKRWIGLHKTIHFGDCRGCDEAFEFNIGIKTDGGGLMMVNVGDMNQRVSLDDRYFVTGTLILFLENGSSIRCFDRKQYDQINNKYYTYYYLTRDEIHLLENHNISAIQFNVFYDYYQNMQPFIDKNLKFLLENEHDRCTKCEIGKLFQPYWLKNNN